MKTKIALFTKRINGYLVEAQSISDIYSEVCYSVTKDEVSEEDVRDALSKIMKEASVETACEEFLRSGFIPFCQEAKDAFNIGDVSFGIEYKEIDIE